MAMGVYISLSARLLVNQESLNMAESVGNITKHRRVPITFQAEDGSYRVVYVPAVSGMSLAHHYQLLLARAADKAGLPVSRMSLQGYFMKYADDKIIQSYYPEVAGRVGKDKSPCENERVIVESDVVADIGGFLYTEGVVKRTSRFSFSYMVPALDALKAASVYPQLHVRYTPEAKKREQALIYVDNASALYTLSYILEASEVSVLNVCRAMGQEPDDLGADERVRRVKTAVEALTAMLGNMAFGAKRSRSLPNWQVQSLVVVASNSIAPFVASPGHDREYLAQTLRRLEAQKAVIDGMDATVHYYAAEKLEGNLSGAVAHPTPEDAVKAAAQWIIKKLGG